MPGIDKKIVKCETPGNHLTILPVATLRAYQLHPDITGVKDVVRDWQSLLGNDQELPVTSFNPT